MDKCFNFAYVTDTHLSDSGEVTAKEILKSDKGFKCIVHGGNALNGNNPEAISMRLLGMEYDRYRSAVKSHIILPVQGEQDGWRNERFKGQLAVNIMTDKVWSDNISFVDKYKGTCRPVDAPYYYVDFVEDKVRLVVLSSYFCEYDEEYGLFEKFRGFKAEQLRWLTSEALNTPEDYRVIIFSNTVPKSRFETGKDPYIYKSWSTEQTLIILQQAVRFNGVRIAAWIAGGYDREEAVNVGGINYITTKSQLGSKCRYSASLSDSTLSMTSSMGTVVSVEY